MTEMNEKRSLLPCATCPWRVEKGADGIPRYSQEAALALRNTVGDGDGLRTIMACHHSSEDEPISCRSYLAQVGWTNINVRLLLARGNLPKLQRIIDACRGLKLHRNYGEMMDKLTLSYERIGQRLRHSPRPDAPRSVTEEGSSPLKEVDSMSDQGIWDAIKLVATTAREGDTCTFSRDDCRELIDSRDALQKRTEELESRLMAADAYFPGAALAKVDAEEKLRETEKRVAELEKVLAEMIEVSAACSRVIVENGLIDEIEQAFQWNGIKNGFGVRAWACLKGEKEKVGDS